MPDDGVMDQFGSDRRTATWTKEFDVHYKPTWYQLMAMGWRSYNWLVSDTGRATDARTSEGNCLVATLCYPYNGRYYIFQCTIPRGDWHARMIAHGPTRAPSWWDAANPSGGSAVTLHAEDGAEFFAEMTMNNLRAQGLRIITYGKKYNMSAAGQVNLCTDPSRKSPPCVNVAYTLRIAYITVPAQQQDAADQAVKPPGPVPGGQSSTTAGQYCQSGGQGGYGASTSGRTTTGGTYYAGGSGAGGAAYTTSRTASKSASGLEAQMASLDLGKTSKSKSSSSSKSSKDATGSKSKSSSGKTSSSKTSGKVSSSTRH